MNQTMKDFLERNELIADKIPQEMNMELTNPQDFNKFLCYFDVQKDKEKRYVCITDIIGSDAFSHNGNIYDLMEKFFDEKGDPYHRRSTDLLEIPSSDIMERLKISFSDDPIILAEYDGKYFVRTNGNHRVFAMYLNYLLESRYAYTPDAKEALKKKYTFPALVGEVDVEKSYANYILQSKLSKKYVDRVYDREQMKITDDYEIVANGERRTVQDESEIDHFVIENFISAIKRKETYLIEQLAKAAKEHKSFRKYFSSLFPQIGENDIASILGRISREISIRNLDLSKAESLEEIIDAIDANDKLLDKQKKGFEKFRAFTTKTDEKMDELFSIMGINQDQTLNIDELTDKFEELIYRIEDMFSEAHKTYSSRVYERAENALLVLSNLDFPLLSREYGRRSIGELKEKISKMAGGIQAEAEIKNLDERRKQESEKKFGLLDKLKGKQRLRDATVQNLSLQRQYVERTMDTPKAMEDAIRDLFNYMKVHGETSETKDFMTRLIKLDKVSDSIKLNSICIESFLPVIRGEKRISARKQAKLLEEENKAMEERVLGEKGQKYSSKVKVDDSIRRNGVLKTISDGIKQAEDETTEKEVKSEFKSFVAFLEHK